MALKSGGVPQQPVPKVSPVPVWPATHSAVAPIRQALLLTCGAAEPAVRAEGAVAAWSVTGQEALGPELVPSQASVGLRAAWLGPGCRELVLGKGCRSQGPESAGRSSSLAPCSGGTALVPAAGEQVWREGGQRTGTSFFYLLRESQESQLDLE